MGYTLTKPAHPALRSHVDHFYDIDLAGAGETVAAPEGRYELVFHLDSAGGFERRDGVHTFGLATLTGMNSEAMTVRAAGRVRAVGVKFFASGLYPFLGVAMTDISNRVWAADDVFPAGDIHQIHARLQAAGTAIETAALLEAFLLIRMRWQADPRVARAADQIDRRGGRSRVAALSLPAGLSDRRLCDLFKRYVGATPKECCRIARFSTAIQRCRSQAGDGLTSTAHACGYSDQSHFIRDVRAFTGRAPGDLLRHRLISDFYNS